MYTEFLVKAGLNNEQAKVYEILIKNGPMPARKASLLSGIKRQMCYKLLDQLIDLGLIEKINNRINIFKPTHPEKITDLLVNRQNEFRLAEQSLKGIMGNLISDYNLYSGKPNVRFYEGVSGVQILYDDIILENKNIKLMRSPFDNDRKDLDKLVQKQLARQIEHQIHTKALTPLMHDSIETTIKSDKSNLVDRRIIPKEEFEIPAQVIIYGDKVALTSYGEYLVTTIIQNRDIRDTFDMIFEYIWQKSQSEHEKILAENS